MGNLVAVEITCAGITPLLMNRMTADVLEGIRTKAKKPKAARSELTPREEAEPKELPISPKMRIAVRIQDQTYPGTVVSRRSTAYEKGNYSWHVDFDNGVKGALLEDEWLVKAWPIGLVSK